MLGKECNNNVTLATSSLRVILHCWIGRSDSLITAVIQTELCVYMLPAKRTFSLKSLVAALAIASVWTWWVTHDRSATLPLSKFQSEQFQIDDSTFRFAVKSIPTHELPRSLRSQDPDLSWLKQSLSVETDPKTGVISLSISSNRGTKSQFLTLLHKIVVYTQPPTMMASSSISSYRQSLEERVADAVQTVDDLFAGEKSKTNESQQLVDDNELNQ